MEFAFDIVSYLVHSKLRINFSFWSLKIVRWVGVEGILYAESFYTGLIAVYISIVECLIYRLKSSLI